jgi:hypothetical protein
VQYHSDVAGALRVTTLGGAPGSLVGNGMDALSSLPTLEPGCCRDCLTSAWLMTGALTVEDEAGPVDRHRQRYRPELQGLRALVVLFALFGASLAYSIWLTAINQPWAYFPDGGVGRRLGVLAPSTCYTSTHSKEPKVCASQTDGVPARRVVLVGDSHVQQYVSALQPIAQQRNWRLFLMVRGSCPFSTAATFGGADRTDSGGFVRQWRALTHAEIPVLAVRDNPRYDDPPSACVNTYGPEAQRCSTLRADIIPAEPSYAKIADPPANVSFLDFSDYFCTKELCPPVIGNVLGYMNDNHTTGTFMTTLSPVVAKAIDAVFGWQPGEHHGS